MQFEQCRSSRGKSHSATSIFFTSNLKSQGVSYGHTRYLMPKDKNSFPIDTFITHGEKNLSELTAMCNSHKITVRQYRRKEPATINCLELQFPPPIQCRISPADQFRIQACCHCCHPGRLTTSVIKVAHVHSGENHLVSRSSTGSATFQTNDF